MNSKNQSNSNFISYATLFFALIGFVYYIYKLFIYLRYSLKYDKASPDWDIESICHKMELFCSANTEYLAIDRAILTIGQLNHIWLVLIACLVLFKVSDSHYRND
jgi:hypothetical protein